MKKVLVVLFILLTSAAILAQTEQEKEEELGGKYSLQFAVGSNFNLSSFEGTAFSGKIKFTDDFALRGGVSLSSYNNDRDVFTDRFDSDGEFYSSDTQNIDESGFAFSLNSNLLWNVIRKSDIFFYVGAGPFIRFENSETKTIFDSGEVSHERDFNYYGIDLLSGAEWFVKNNISLFGEYGLSFYFKNGSYFDKQSDNREIKSDESQFNIQNLYVKLGVSLYF